MTEMKGNNNNYGEKNPRTCQTCGAQSSWPLPDAQPAPSQVPC